jgi:hypothetical protein
MKFAFRDDDSRIRVTLLSPIAMCCDISGHGGRAWVSCFELPSSFRFLASLRFRFLLLFPLEDVI